MDAAQQEAIEAFGHVFESLGANYNFGRMWAYLHVVPDAVTQQELAVALNISQSVVSTTIRQLLAAQMAEKRRGRRGEPARYAVAPVSAGLAVKASQARMQVICGLFERLALVPLPEQSVKHIAAQLDFYRYMADGMRDLIARWEAQGGAP